MAITMTRRERTLLAATILLVLVGVTYRFGLKGGIEALAQQRQGLRQAKTDYEDMIDYLRRKEEPVIREFRELEKRYRMGEQDEKEFRASTENMLKSYNVMQLKMDPPRHEPIEGLGDYAYLTLPFSCDADNEKVAKILTYFDQHAILVQDLKLTGALDSPVIRISATISQMVKLSSEMKEKMAAQEKAGSLGGSSQPRKRRFPGQL